MPFLDLAHGLAEYKIAFVRYNKRYYQYPELAEDDLTIEDEVLEDINTVIEAALTVNLELPMLFLQGTDDFQVTMEEDFQEWKTLLENKENVTSQSYEGLNHLFMPSNGAGDSSEYEEKSEVDEKVICDISEWILSNMQ